MTLLNQDTGVMDTLCKIELVNASLQSALQEILDLEGQHVIELHAGLIEHTDTNETTNEGISFEETLGILLIESEELTSLTLDFIGIKCLACSYRAARRIFESVSMTRHTSRLLRRPYSPTSFNSESLKRVNE